MTCLRNTTILWTVYQICYPEFLRKRHGSDSELKQFIQSLPEVDPNHNPNPDNVNGPV